MKRGLLIVGAVALTVLVAVLVMHRSDAEWAGVDETVVEKFAQEAGREAREPLINTDRGDLLLFVFLVAGAAGGFVFGYYFRGLFPPRRQAVDEARTSADARRDAGSS